jgi:molybdate transport system ATP-binding protein
MAPLHVDAVVPLRDFELRVALDVGAETVALAGPSGAGKTTLLRAVAGLVEGARVRSDGRDWTGLPPERRSVGFVFQDYALFPHLTVRANVAFGGEMGDLLERLRIAHLADARPRELSGGERQRVALARALARRP